MAIYILGENKDSSYQRIYFVVTNTLTFSDMTWCSAGS